MLTILPTIPGADLRVTQRTGRGVGEFPPRCDPVGSSGDCAQPQNQPHGAPRRPEQKFLLGRGADRYLVIQGHPYDPWTFWGRDVSNAAYPGREIVEQSLGTVAKYGRHLNVPISYGEFGVGRESDQSARDTAGVREFYRTVVRTVLAEGMSGAAWDNRSWFRLVVRNADRDDEFDHDIMPPMLASDRRDVRLGAVR